MELKPNILLDQICMALAAFASLATARHFALPSLPAAPLGPILLLLCPPALAALRSATLWALALTVHMPPARLVYAVTNGPRAPGRLRFFGRTLVTDARDLTSNCGAGGHSSDEDTDFTGEGLVPTSALNKNDPLLPRRRLAIVKAMARVQERIDDGSLARLFKERFRLRRGEYRCLQSHVSHELMLPITFEIVFGRPPKSSDDLAILEGARQPMLMVKRRILKSSAAVEREYIAALERILDGGTPELFKDIEAFIALPRSAQRSVVAADFMQSFTDQTGDALCHLLWAAHDHPDAFARHNRTAIILEVLRVWPLNEFFFYSRLDKGAMFCDLHHLNRVGHTRPDDFDPGRWNVKGCPVTIGKNSNVDRRSIMSFSFGSRTCPAYKHCVQILRIIWDQLEEENGLRVVPAANMIHERSFYLPFTAVVAGKDGGDNETIVCRNDRLFRDYCWYYACRNYRMFHLRELW